MAVHVYGNVSKHSSHVQLGGCEERVPKEGGHVTALLSVIADTVQPGEEHMTRRVDARVLLNQVRELYRVSDTAAETRLRVRLTSSMPTSRTPLRTSPPRSFSQPHFGIPQMTGSSDSCCGSACSSWPSMSIRSSGDKDAPSIWDHSAFSAETICSALGTVLNSKLVALTSRVRPPPRPAGGLESSLRSRSGVNGLPSTGSEDRQRSMPIMCVGVTGVGGAEIG